MEYSDFIWTDSQNIIEAFRERAENAVPEWKLDAMQPDLGFVFVRLFAEMLADTGRMVTDAVSGYPIQLYNMLGACPLPPGEAKGYVTFQTVNDEVAGAYMNQGFRIDGTTESGDLAGFTLEQDVFVSPARLKTACFVDGSKDKISQLFSFPVRERELKNRQSHRFYIGHSYLFSLGSAGDIILDFCDGREHGERLPSKEAMERMRWRYHSTEGYTPFASCRYEAGRLYLHKNKSMPSGERALIEKTEAFWLMAETDYMKPGEEILVPVLTLRAESSDIVPDIIFDGSMELEQEEFLPFGERLFMFQELYICSDEVFCKRGAKLSVSFDLDFLEFAGELHTPEYTGRRKNIMKKSDFIKKEPVNVAADAVCFEYYNGVGFTKIPDVKAYGGIFSRGQNAGKKQLEFRCPEDICPYLVSAKETGCIRLRICGLTNPYPVDGVYLAPRIKNMRLGYRYEDTGRLPEYLFRDNETKTEFLPCRGTQRFFFHSFPAGKQLYLCFTRPLNEEGISLLLCLRDGIGAPPESNAGPHQPALRAGSVCRFEYYAQNGWQAFHVFDETGGLKNTGLVSTVSEHAFCWAVFFGCCGYWLRIVWDEAVYGSNKPVTAKKARDVLAPIRGIYLNSAAVSAQPGTGAQGNLPAGALNTLERSVGFINQAENKEGLFGGYDREDTLQAKKRLSAAFRHRRRAVTAGDYEDIVCSQVRNVLQVRCFPGRDAAGKQAPGHITLVVLPPKGERQFAGMKKNIYDCLASCIDERILEEERLHIVLPQWVSVQVNITLMPGPGVRSHVLKEKLTQWMNTFLDPVAGNFDKKGWRIGTLPSCVQMENACEQMEEIVYVKRISMNRGREPGPYALAYGKDHEIFIER